MPQTELQYLLGKLAEEAGEIAQMVNKTKDFGFDEIYPPIGVSNRERLHTEINDLIDNIRILNSRYDFGYDFSENPRRTTMKTVKVDKYYAYSKALGLAE